MFVLHATVTGIGGEALDRVLLVGASVAKADGWPRASL